MIDDRVCRARWGRGSRGLRGSRLARGRRGARVASRCRGQGRGAAWWPPSSGCISSGTLTMSAPALSVSAGACWPRPSPFADGAGLASARVHKKKSVIKLENGNALNKTLFVFAMLWSWRERRVLCSWIWWRKVLRSLRDISHTDNNIPFAYGAIAFSIALINNLWVRR
jgi:hypothetical protein